MIDQPPEQGGCEPGPHPPQLATVLAGGPVQKAQNITALRDTGVKMIGDGTTILTEP